MKITFWGAAQNVTGSKHLIQTENFNLLLDCGMTQGKRQQANEQNETLPFDAQKIDAVILSHAHLDHCGTLPVLVKSGFIGKIYCTPATAEIAKCILSDSANIQEQDSEYLARHGQQVAPIYTQNDVEKTLQHFETVEYFRDSNKWTELNENIKFKFYDAGHILGSAVTLLQVTENGEVKNLVFTGDLGREYSPILRHPENVQENAQTLLSECTYGDSNHKPISEAIKQLKETVYYATKSKGKIIVPAFSLGRTQDLIYIIHRLVDAKEIPALPIYIDSPLAEDIVEIFSRYTKNFNDEFKKYFGAAGTDAFEIKNLHYVRSVEESKKLNSLQGPFMVISASGMCEGGRVLHHLKNNITDARNIILITGYQAENTLGRRIQEGISPVKIFGAEYDVRAKIISLEELSAHADSKSLMEYIEKINGLKNVFLVHTELERATAFKGILDKSGKNYKIDIPSMGESFEI